MPKVCRFQRREKFPIRKIVLFYSWNKYKKFRLCMCNTFYALFNSLSDFLSLVTNWNSCNSRNTVILKKSMKYAKIYIIKYKVKECFLLHGVKFSFDVSTLLVLKSLCLSDLIRAKNSKIWIWPKIFTKLHIFLIRHSLKTES